jgi:hypothetical protein
MKTVCPFCQCADLRQELTPAGPHFGRLTCNNCGRFLQWIPKPVETVDYTKLHLPDPLPQGDPLPGFATGTKAQIEYAVNLRYKMISELGQSTVPRTVALAALTIRDAAWWIGNAKRWPEEYRWPKEWL